MIKLLLSLILLGVAISLLITFAPVLLMAAAFYFLFRKKRPVAAVQMFESTNSTDKNTFEAQWREIKDENTQPSLQ